MSGLRIVRAAQVAAPGSTSMATGPFGSSISSRFFRRSGVPVIRGANLSTDSSVRLSDENLVFLDPSKAAELSRSTVRSGDLIFTCWGTINQIGLIDESAGYNEYVISNKQMKLTPDPSVADSEFLYYYFSAPPMQREILEGSIGSSIPGFNLTRLRSLEIELPPLVEQKRIAEAMNDADAFIRSLERLISKRQAIKEGMGLQLLAGHLRLPGFYGTWPAVELSSVASGSRGSGLSKSAVVRHGSRKCLLYGELFTTYGRTIREVRSRTNAVSGVASSSGQVLLPGSTTTVARDLAVASALMVDDVLIGGDVNVLSPDLRRVDPSWLAHFLTVRRKEEIAAIAQGITIVHLYVKSILRLAIPLPSLAEQQAMSAVLQDADEVLALLYKRLQKARLIKQGMMQELLTGRTRLMSQEVSA